MGNGAPNYLAGSGAIWVQPDGPNSQPYYLGCHSLGPVEKPRGDAVLIYKPNIEVPNVFDTLGIYQQGPGPTTSSIEFVLKSTIDWLETVICPVPLYVHKVDCGRLDVFDNYDRSFILHNTIITTETKSGLATNNPEDQTRSMQSVDLASQTVHSIFRLSTGEQRAVGVAGRTALAIAFVGPMRCYGSCGGPRAKCEIGYIGLDGVIGTPTNVYWTDDGGLVWYPTAANPFQSHEDVSGIAIVQSTVNTQRVIAARGTIDGLNPMEVAYSDDQGTSWSNRDAGSVNGQYAIGRGNCLWAHNSTNIWLVTTGGYIYFSRNAGDFWATQENGGITTQDLHAVHFCSDRIGYAVGAGNTILRTLNGEDWSAVIGPAAEVGNIATCVHVLDKSRVWVGYDSGNVWYTLNGGSSWYQRSFPGDGVGEVQDIKFCNDYVGYIAHISAGGTVGSLFRTINGGWSWTTQPLPASTGPLYSMHVCDCNSIYAVGDF